VFLATTEVALRQERRRHPKGQAAAYFNM
jgi:hypothetical protein